MTNTYCLIDAFAQNPFGGVPITVFTHGHTIKEQSFGKVASEMPTSETVFIKKQNDDAFELRIFSQQGEQGFAAHTSVAALKAIHHTGLINEKNNYGVIKLINQDGVISGLIEKNDDKETILISKKFERNVDHFVPRLEETANTIGLKIEDIDTHNYSNLIVSTGLPYLFVPLKSYTAIREAYFHRNAWSQSSLPTSLVDKIFLFAPNTDSEDGDFHCRLLDGNSSNNDPAIGEAAPAFAAYLCEQKHVRRGTHVFTLRRGANKARQSYLHVEMDNFGEDTLNLRIGGSAYVTAQAKLIQEP